MESLVIVANRLPVKVSKQDGKLVFESSPGGLASAMSGVEGKDVKWVGWPGIASDELTPAERRTVTQRLKRDGYYAVHQTQEEVEKYYEGYANNTLWPLFHYLQNDDVPQKTKEVWNTYKAVNQRFAKEAAKHLDKNTVTWVQDYHLMLVPSYLRERAPEAKIGFFLHIPFPSYEIFRTLPERTELLRGLLGADLIGFHTYDYARHFLSSCLRTFGISNHNGKLLHQNRQIVVDAFPLGIDVDKFRNTLTSEETLQIKREIHENYGEYKLILSVDRLDYTKGFLHRLEAFGRFLEKYPAMRQKVVLMMVAQPSRAGVERYQWLRDEVERLVSRINGEFGTVDWTPVIYYYQGVQLDRLVALYSSADVALITPLRDGMNLVAKEYVVAQAEENPGVLVLSEMTGASEELAEALPINPYDIENVADVLHQALKLPKSERKIRFRKMYRRLSAYPPTAWANDFCAELVERTDQAELRFLSNDDATLYTKQFASAASSLILLDYDGTLRSFVKSPDPAAARPSQKLKAIIRALGEHSGCRVVIISGRTKEALEAWFHDSPVDLVAEHGAWRRTSDGWQKTVDEPSPDIRAKALALMRQTANRTPGAAVEEKDFSLVWHYRNVSPELAYVRASVLRHDLRNICEASELAVFDGHKVIEVKPTGIDKGQIAAQYLREYNPEFSMVIGDDYTDESMFEVASSDTITIKVGEGQTVASERLPDVAAVLKLLEALPKNS